MKLLLLTGILLICLTAKSETKYTTIQYVEMWKETAVLQMNKHKIPASITLAQGILESANGNSKLAKEANNHFGIKCHKVWRGATFIQDDDTKDECFRSYKSAMASYNDHSLFLVGRKRYAALFELKLRDYKGWAKGLKSAGYATNPKYAHLLINLIERFNLDQYDQKKNQNFKLTKSKPDTNLESTITKPAKKTTVVKDYKTIKGHSNSEIIQIQTGVHKVKSNKNKVKYIVVREGDTFYRIAKELQLTINQLYKYNEFKNKDVLEVGDIIFVGPKRSKALKKNEMYICDRNISLREIAHEEGLKLKSLMKLNLSQNPDEVLIKNSKVILR